MSLNKHEDNKSLISVFLQVDFAFKTNIYHTGFPLWQNSVCPANIIFAENSIKLKACWWSVNCLLFGNTSSRIYFANHVWHFNEFVIHFLFVIEFNYGMLTWQNTLSSINYKRSGRKCGSNISKIPPGPESHKGEREREREWHSKQMGLKMITFPYLQGPLENPERAFEKQ